MARRTFDDIVSTLTTFITGKVPTLDTKTGTFTRDVLIDPLAVEMDNFYQNLELIANNQVIDSADDNSLVKLASNFGLTRKPAVVATGSVTFYRTTTPGAPITIPAGTTISTQATLNDPAEQFATTQTVQLTASDFNATTGRYEKSAPVAASLPGAKGNVAQQTIVALVQSISGITGVVNSNATSGGADQESITALRTRLKTKLLGNNVGTRNGYFNLVLSQSAVSDAKTVSFSDSGSKRTQIGSVDVFIKGKQSSQVIETFTFFAGNQIYTPLNQPADVNVTTTAIGEATKSSTLVKDVDWKWDFDTGAYGGSTRAQNNVRWLFQSGSNRPLDGELVTLTYTYNSLIPTIQTLLLADNNKVVGADILAKWGRERSINVTASIKVLPGFTFSTVQSSVVTSLTTFLNSFTFGQAVQKADVVKQIVDTSGVDDVNLTTLTISSADTDLNADSLGNLAIPTDSYAIAGTLTITQFV